MCVHAGNGVGFIRVSGGELVQKYIGEGIESPAWLEALQEQLFGFTGSRMVRELFVMAREHAPTIIFMDEAAASEGSRRLS